MAYLVLKVVKSGLVVHETETVPRGVSFEMSKEESVEAGSSGGSKA